MLKMAGTATRLLLRGAVPTVLGLLVHIALQIEQELPWLTALVQRKHKRQRAESTGVKPVRTEHSRPWGQRSEVILTSARDTRPELQGLELRWRTQKEPRRPVHLKVWRDDARFPSLSTGFNGNNGNKGCPCSKVSPYGPPFSHCISVATERPLLIHYCEFSDLEPTMTCYDCWNGAGKHPFCINWILYLAYICTKEYHKIDLLSVYFLIFKKYMSQTQFFQTKNLR